MVTRYLSGFRDNDCDGGFEDCKEDLNGDLVAYKDYQELEAENARLRQRLDFVIDQLSNATEDAALLLKQRNAANAQLDFILDNLKEEKAP